MKNILFALVGIATMLGLCAVHNASGVVASNGTMERGTSVVCPDNTSQWICSINSSLPRNAPPPLGIPILAERNAQGRLTITVFKTDLPPSANGTWFQNDKFYTPQTIEMARSLYMDVMGVDAVKSIDPGFYPIFETETTYQIIF